MAGLIKELYLDYAKNKLSIEERSDLAYAIQLAYKTYLVNLREIDILDYYLQGYNASEIALLYKSSKIDISEKQITECLTKVFVILEILTNYTDKDFLHRMQFIYSPRKLKKLEQFIYEHGRTFIER